MLDLSNSGRTSFRLQLEDMQAAMPRLRVLKLSGLGGMYGERGAEKLLPRLMREYVLMFGLGRQLRESQHQQHPHMAPACSVVATT